MMVDDPRKRKAHVKRIYISDPVDTGEVFNPNAGPTSGDPSGTPTDTSTWIDVLRIENMFITYKALDTGKITSTRYDFTWNDDPQNPADGVDADAQQENGNPARKMKQVLVHNPQDYDPQNPNDGTLTPLWCINKTPVKVRGGGQPGLDSGVTNQRVNWQFNNINPADTMDDPSKIPSKRDVSTVRVTNNDLTGADGNQLKMADDDNKAILVSWDTYLEALQNGDTDDSQFVDVEFADAFSIVFGADLANGIKGQTIKYKMTNNKDIEEATSNIDGTLLFEKTDDATAADPSANLPPPVRTDPLQLIVNVSWQDPKDFVLCGTKYTGGTPSTSAKFLMYSKDGKDWTEVTTLPPPLTFDSSENLGPVIQTLVYGGGTWLMWTFNPDTAMSQVWRSMDLFKTWDKLNPITPSILPPVAGLGTGSGVCWGKPKKKIDNEPAPHGIFMSGDLSNILYSTDLGDTWKSTSSLGIPPDDGEYANGVVSIDFIEGVFYLIVEKIFIVARSPAFIVKPGKLILYISEDGKKWDGGTEILNEYWSTGTHNTVYDYTTTPEGGAAAASPTVYPEVDWIQLSARKLKKNSSAKKWVITGQARPNGFNTGHGFQLFYAEADDPKQFNSATVYGKFGDILLSPFPVTSDGKPYAMGDWQSPRNLGGTSVAIGETVVMDHQVVTYSSKEFDYVNDGDGPDDPVRRLAYGFCDSNQEGVQINGSGPTYFTGDTISYTTWASFHTKDGTRGGIPDPNNPILFTSQEPAASTFDYTGDTNHFVIGNTVKDKELDKANQIGTVLYVRTLALDPTVYRRPDIDPPVNVNGGLELWHSNDGVNFAKTNHPLGSTPVDVFYAYGKTPTKPKNQ
jgi:hypothetical protein